MRFSQSENCMRLNKLLSVLSLATIGFVSTATNAEVLVPTGEIDVIATSQLEKGLTKQRILSLIGQPKHVQAKRNKWDYVLDIRVPNEYPAKRCQLQIDFDSLGLVSGLYWNKKDCAALANPLHNPLLNNPVIPLTIVDIPEVKPPVIMYRDITVSSDALFPFDKYKVEDMYEGSISSLLNVVAELNKEVDKISTVTVIGLTDRLGSDAYNQTLSQNRANTIRDVLLLNGLKLAPERISAVGRGESMPITNCSDDLPREALIDCLAPDRRIVLRIDYNDNAERIIPSNDIEMKPKDTYYQPDQVAW